MFIEHIESLREESGGLQFRQARINPTWDGTLRPTVIWDGETTATTKSYPYLSRYTPVAGDVVLMARVGNSWVIIDKINS